ncbi:MAG: DUF1294 domain-containing protein [Lachnospiraceae bacterium]|nr:DUF1294 domain-containing protein [Lachnospiraceae bacterium]
MKILLIYLVTVNIMAVLIYGLDKAKAKMHRWRIPEKVLFAIAFAGGALGALLAMYLFRHKVRKKYFKIGIPLILILQVVIVVAAYSKGLL